MEANLKNYEYPAPPPYESLPYAVPMRPVPPPPPYSPAEPTGQSGTAPPTRSPPWDRKKKIYVTTITVIIVVIVAVILIGYFASRQAILLSPPTCQVYCSFSFSCISSSQICDGVGDCLFGDDEENCGPQMLPTFPTCQFCSFSSNCIRANQICNGIADCPYGDDEENCGPIIFPSLPSCPMYCISTFMCISAKQICNGIADCPYGDDEENCVRLYGADSQLQVYSTLKSAWLPVCADNWTDAYGRLACQDIGYNGSSYNRSDTMNSTYAPNGYFQLKNGSQTSKLYSSIEHSSSCSLGQVVSLRCISCGVSYNSVASHKVGGTKAASGNWPWHVGLRYKTGLLCGGSIISPKWIVTAAHCVYGSRSSTSGWKVFAGALTLPSYSDANGYSVERIIVFPGYNSSNNDNDIALMKLTDKITFNYNTQPVCLPNAGMFWEAGTQCWISGWGTTSQGDNIARTLQYAEVQLVPSHVCNQSHVYNGSITPSMLCADGLYGRIGSCQGDAGGPLVTKTNGTWWLVGDTSWGVGCAQPNKPGVYGNMAMFVEWIYLQMRTYS
uniref:Transmembrane serine protease 2 n=1 Tax=Xenopus tropicalis TaxID=8364 RepID=A0A803J2L4_XENTR